MHSVEIILCLVVAGTFIATFARHLRVPAPSLLVLVGVVMGLVPGVPDVRVTPDLVSLVVLPPLLAAAGEELSWRDLSQVWRPVSILAVGLVLASAAAVGAVAVLCTPLSATDGFLLGAILASTDPVAVSALARRLALPPRVRATIQAESLFNDATSLVLFRVVVAVAVVGGGVQWGDAFGRFALLAGGGAAAGAVTAIVIAPIRRRTLDPSVDTVIALVTPYAAYIFGEAVHGSGVTAVVVASLALARRGERLTTSAGRLRTDAVFGTAVFVLESVVFALIGLELPTLIRQLSGAQQLWPLQALAIVATLIVVRVAWVFPLSVIFRTDRHASSPTGERLGPRASWRVPAVVSWAGARGVVPLAAALSVPVAVRSGAPFPHRDLLLVLASTVIVITLVIQGSTLSPLVHFAGIAIPPDDTRDELTVARREMAAAALDRLDDLADAGAAPDAIVERLRQSLQRRAAGAAGPEGRTEDPMERAYREVRLDLIGVEREQLDRLHDAGQVTDATRRRLQRGLDLEVIGLDDIEE